MPTGVELQLFDGATPAANLTGIQALWWDVTEPKDASRPVGKSSVVTTNATGHIHLDLSNVTGLAPTDEGFLMLYKLDGTDHQDSPMFAGKVAVSTITSGVDMYYYDSGWTRPAGWLAMPEVLATDQKFVGLHTVYPENSNFVALLARGAYTVDWGDGSAAENVADNVQAQRNIAWADVTATTDVGIASAVACTFQDTGDTVTVTGHDFKAGERVSFSSITTTTGITTHTLYWVRDVTADTFKVAATQAGAALTLTTDGTGTVYHPRYRQVLITVTPQAAVTLTSFQLNRKHTQTGLQAYAAGWLDCVFSGPSTTSLVASGTTVPSHNMEQFRLLSFGGTTLDSLVRNAVNLRSVSIEGTGSVLTFASVFRGCDSLQSVPLLNTASGTNFSFMFSGCSSLQSVPLLNTASGTTFSNMFNSCSSLQSIPLLNTANGTTFASMFNSCSSLQSIPLLNTASGMTFSNMFNSCSSLQSVPLLNTANGTTFASMFNSCSSLQSIPLLNTASGTNFASMFSACSSLERGALSGTTRAISYASCKLSGAELNRIYENLGAPDAGAQTITVTNNWGTATDDPTLVPAGWTVSGS